MNCTKCGKELSDGRRKICKECAEQEKKEKEELKAKKAAEKKTKEETKKVDSKKASKVEKEKEVIKEEKKKSCCKPNKKCIIIVVVAIIAILVLMASLLSKKGTGNTIGNIRNYGYATINGNYIYYLAPNDDSTAVGIFKIKKDGTGEPKQLFMEDMDVVSINVYNGYVYFIGDNPNESTAEDKIDNKIYRMSTNGDNVTVINDNEFNNDCYEIYVIKGSIYYIGTDNNIYKMDLKGGNRTLVSDNQTGYLGITEKYIIYNVEGDEAADYTTYIMNLDGTNQRPIIDGERLYSVNISGDYVYYTNVDKKICRTKIDSGKPEEILDTSAYNMNLYEDYIYFLNYKDIENEDYTVCLYRIKADGSEKEATTIKELDTYSSFINIIGDWVIYMDSNETEGFINLVKTDGSNERCVYLLNYEEYYNSVSSENNTAQPETETTEEPTVDETAPEATPENTETTPAPEGEVKDAVSTENAQ